MAKFLIKHIKGNEDLINKISQASNLPGSVAIKLRRIAKTLLNEAKDCDVIRDAKIQELGVRDGDKIEVKSENWNTYFDYMTKILSTEIEVEYDPINVSVFEGEEKSPLTPAELDGLIFLGILKDDALAEAKGSLRDIIKGMKKEVVVQEGKPGEKKYAKDDQ